VATYDIDLCISACVHDASKVLFNMVTFLSPDTVWCSLGSVVQLFQRRTVQTKLSFKQPPFSC
jgi:hypothetical protein